MTAYYNEIDPYVAQWLRNLIQAGHIAPGDVDERSIVDVRGADLVGYQQCHFFAGIGGWSLALRLAGWPDNRHVWTGSCPCQPLSSAGQQQGHADKRHLWPAFYSLIAERSPSIVFGEQVAGEKGLEWLAGVRADLEAAGYAVGGADLCAAGVSAPHERARLFFVANAAGIGRDAGADDSRVLPQGLCRSEGWAVIPRAGAGSRIFLYPNRRHSPSGRWATRPYGAATRLRQRHRSSSRSGVHSCRDRLAETPVKERLRDMEPKEAYEARKAERAKLKDMEYQLKSATEGLMMLDMVDRLATAFERIAEVLENPRTTFDPR